MDKRLNCLRAYLFTVFLTMLIFLALFKSTAALASTLAETEEILFSGDATAIANKASQLDSAAAIYEYVRNHYDHTVYQGSLSNALNIYLGKSGNDVDLASLLIAMYRSQGIPAQYASGVVKAPAADVANWLGVLNVDLAVKILNDVGIADVALSMSGATQMIEFEHTWVQVLVPFSEYRGLALAQSADCVATPAACQWINIDPSWKLKTTTPSAIDVYNTITFDYERFYNAIKDNDLAYRDKGLVEIYQEEILAWLRTNHPGKTLNDLAIFGDIIAVNDGVLPASLPYQVLGSINVYSSVDEHDLNSTSHNWKKTVELQFSLDNFNTQGYSGVVQINATSPKISLAQMSTKRLSWTYAEGNGVSGDAGEHHRLLVRLDDNVVHTPLVVDVSNDIATVLGVAYQMNVAIEGFRPSEGFEQSIRQIGYQGFQYGESHVFNLGKNQANASQVQRAANQLILAGEQYSIIHDASDVPYVDVNEDGSVDAGDIPLIDHPEARTTLTLGLLDVNSRLYAAKSLQHIELLDTVNHIYSPIDLHYSLTSSTLDVEYFGDTPFSVVPGGLLIDAVNVYHGFWRVDDGSAQGQTAHAEMLTTQGSVLEHEIWQETTGFDAISTVRGIQFAVADGSEYLTPENTGSGNNWLSLYTDFQYADTVPAGFTYTPFTLYGTQPATWTHTQELSQMQVMRREVDSSMPLNSLSRRGATYQYALNGGLYGWVSCADNIENGLLAAPDFQQVMVTYCDGTVFNGLVTQVRDQVRDRFLNHTVPVIIGQELFDYFDRLKGFDPADYIYRSAPLSSTQHDEQLVRTIRDNIMIGDSVLYAGLPARFEYRLANFKSDTGFNIFSVYVEKALATTASVGQIAFIISNDGQTAGGGWTDGESELSASDVDVTIIQPDFNNELFNDEDLVSQVHNDLVRTPSTVDPVSTVSGNMYHDETDITIKGRGLPYVFTRTYNSGPGSSDVDGPLGYGWTHSYNMGLISNDYGDCPNCTPGTDTASGERPENGNNIPSSITYVDERGGAHTYLLNADSAGTRSISGNPPGEFDTLQLNTPVAGKHTLLFRNGVHYVFEEITASSLLAGVNQFARLDYIEDPYNNRLTMGYDGDGRLISVTDNLAIAGRTGLSLTYHGATPHIHTVSDWSGRTWTYQYDANDNLDSMTDPLNQVMDYTYHGEHLLDKITKPQDRAGQKNSMAFSYYHNKKAFDYVNTLGEVESLSYDLYRQKTQVTDPRGFMRTYFYDTDHGALKKLEEPDGAILLFDNNADGLRYKKTDGLGYETQYSFQADRSISAAASNTNGLVTREIDALNQLVDYNYAVHDQLGSTVDKRGTTFTRQYHTTTDSVARTVEGKLRIEQVVMNGQTETLRRYYYYADPTQSNFGQLQRIQDFFDPGDINRRRLTRFYWAANGIDLERVDVYGLANGQITTDINRTTYTYDALGRRLSETLHRRTSATDATQQKLTTHYEYDALDRIIKTTNPRGDIAEVVYDENGQVYQQKVHYLTGEPRDHCTATVIDSLNYQSCTYVTNTYDAADRLNETADILGHSQQFDYDALGNVIKQRDANGNETRFEYDAMNRRTAIIDANGYKTQFVYDLAGRLIETIDANDHRVKHTYDAIGRLTQTLSEEGRETEFQYDANGNLTHTLDANATAHAGHPRNAQNATVYTEYDELNRPVRVVDALDGETLTEYDLQGNITRITDAEGQVTQFIYDELGRLIETIDPIIENGTDLTKKVTLYNEANQPLIREDRAGNVFHYGYDVLGRLTTVDVVGGGYIERYNYNDFGDLVSQGNTSVNYLYDYTSRHEMQQKTDIRENKTLNWVYDAAGNVIMKTDYQGEVTHYQYDSTNRLTAMQNRDYLQVSYHYDGAGRLLNRILSNGAQTNYKYDDDNRLIELENLSLDPANPAQKQTVEKLIYQRDEVGNITQVNNAAALATVDYVYDALYRLTSVDSSFNSADRAYSYDKVGNRKTETKNGTTYYYCYHVTDCSQPPNGNRLHAMRTGSLTGPLYRQYAYDVRGNMTARRDGNNVRLAGFSYNAANQATQLFDANGAIRFAGYDVLGYRVGTALTGSFSQVVEQSNYYLEGEHIEAIYTDIGCDDTNPSESSGCTTEDAVFNLDKKYLRGVVVDEIVNGYDYHSSDDSFNENDWTNTTFHHDHINSVTALTGHDGRIDETYGFDAFGAPLSAVNSNNLLFTGREYDRGTATYYYRARYYDPEIGRFISEDPIGFMSGQVNHYAYCSNNPVNCTDPTGLVDFVDLGFGIIDFGFSTAEALTGVGLMILSPTSGPAVPATFWAGTALTSHGSLGMANSILDIRNALNDTSGPGVFELVGESFFGDRGQQFGEAADLFTGLRPAAIASGSIGNFNDLYDFTSGLRSLESFSDNSGVNANSNLNLDMNLNHFNIPNVPIFENPLNNGGVNSNLNFNFDFNNTGGFNTDINFDFRLNPYTGVTGGDYNFNFDGGFVIYPSKPNNNGLRRVYKK